MELARWLPLGDESCANSVCPGIGPAPPSGRQPAANGNCSCGSASLGSFQGGEASARAGQSSDRRKGLSQGSRYTERMILRVLRPNINFLETGAYIFVALPDTPQSRAGVAGGW